MLLAFMLLSSLAAWLKVPPVTRIEVETLPPRLAKLVLHEKPKPPQEKKPPPEAEKKPQEPVLEKKKPPLSPDVQAARKKAAHSGLLALSNELAGMRKSDLGDLAGNKILIRADDKAAIHRSIIVSQALRGSGGIGTAQLSRDPGHTRLAGRDTTTVESDALSAERQGSNKLAHPGRSIEEIQLTLDRSKGALYALYHRALRVNPALQGKVVLEITIAPHGEVTSCKVASAELADDDLIRKLVARILLINFGAKDVPPVVFTWPIDFLPSS